MLFEVPFSGKSPGLEGKKKRTKKFTGSESEILRAEPGGSHTAYLEGFQRHALCLGGVPRLVKGGWLAYWYPRQQVQIASPHQSLTKSYGVCLAE